MLPGYFCRCAIFATMEQDEFRTLAGFEEVSFDVADESGSVMISGHVFRVAKLQEGYTTVDSHRLTGHEIT